MSDRMERIGAMKTAAMRCAGCIDKLIEATQLLHEGAGFYGDSGAVRKVVAAHDATGEAYDAILRAIEECADE